MIAAYTLAYIAAYFASKAGHDYLSGIILVLTAIALYVNDYLRTKNIINLRGLFALSFVGGEGVSCLKLSYLQTEWHIMTWVCFFVAFIVFYAVYEIILIKKKKNDNGQVSVISRRTGTGIRIIDTKRLFICIVVLTAVSSACFVFEAMVLGYIPLFVKGVPHAYSYFHISGVHYFTVSCVLIPAMAVLWGIKSEKRSAGNIAVIIICSMIAFSIPLLCVSRFQFVFAVAMAVFTYIIIKKNVSVRIAGCAFAAAIAAFAVLSIARSHDAEYLNSIFEMKYNLPVDISRIYIYIANNYDNFDCMVKGLTGHSMGMRVLFPVWALTGLKFVCPELVNFPLFVTKEELTTVTLFYDFYYDFGIIGVLAGSGIIGAAARIIEKITVEKEDPMFSLFYSQYAIYMALAFFTTWFSNPTTWFYFVITAILYCICMKKTEQNSPAFPTG